MGFTKAEVRVIRLALSHYAYADSHDPEQRPSDIIAAKELCKRIDEEGW